VSSQLAEPARRVTGRFERETDRAVEPQPLARRQFVVQRRAHQSVGESVGTRPAAHRLDQSGRLGRIERVEHLVGAADDLAERA
jgi:hypothetical protein